MSVYQIVKLNFEALVQFQAEVSFHGNRFSLDQLQAHFINFSGPRWESLYDKTKCLTQNFSQFVIHLLNSSENLKQKKNSNF